MPRWVYEAKFDFFSERGVCGEWIIVCYKQKGKKIVVLDVGTEVSLDHAKVFGRDAVLYWSGKSIYPPMDMHDRATMMIYLMILNQKFGAVTFEDQQ